MDILESLQICLFGLLFVAAGKVLYDPRDKDLRKRTHRQAWLTPENTGRKRSYDGTRASL